MKQFAKILFLLPLIFLSTGASADLFDDLIKAAQESEDKRLLNEGLNYTYKEGLVFERTTSLGPGADMGERLAKLGPKAKKKK